MWKSTGALIQKAYDDSYKNCITAVYFEKKWMEKEALEYWQLALSTIEQAKCNKSVITYTPRNYTERALIDSVHELERQCRERIKLFQASLEDHNSNSSSSNNNNDPGNSPDGPTSPTVLTRPRRSASSSSPVPAAATAAPTTTSTTSTSSSAPSKAHTSSAMSRSNSKTGVIANGTVPALSYNDIARPSFPMSSSSRNVPPCDVPASGFTDSDDRPTSSGPETVEKHILRTTLRPPRTTADGKPTSREKRSLKNSLRPGASKAASAAWVSSSDSPRHNATSRSARDPASSAQDRSVHQASGGSSHSHPDRPQWDRHSRRLIFGREREREKEQEKDRDRERDKESNTSPRASLDAHATARAAIANTAATPASPTEDLRQAMHFSLHAASNALSTESNGKNRHSPPMTVPPMTVNTTTPLSPLPTLPTPTSSATAAASAATAVNSPLSSLRNVSPSTTSSPPTSSFKTSSTTTKLPASSFKSSYFPPTVGPVPCTDPTQASARNAVRRKPAPSGKTSNGSAHKSSEKRESVELGRRQAKSKESTSAQDPTLSSSEAVEEPSPPPPPSIPSQTEWEAQQEAILQKLPFGVDAGAAKQILNEIVVQGDEVRWTDVAGLDVAKTALRETVVYPFLRPDLFMGLREPARGMLLFGPPGTGKTMLARAVATESKSTFFSISASSLTSKYLGESEKLVRALFSLARMLAPSIIFVDEIDSLLGQRSGPGDHEATRRIKTEFLIQWSDLQRAAAGREVSDGDRGRGDATRVLVLAATNLPWVIDEAARRRFVRRQYIPLPEPETRAIQFLNLLGQQKHSLSEDEIARLVDLTDGFSGSDITALAKDAAMGPLRLLGEAVLHMSMEDIRAISYDDFLASLKTIRPSVSKSGLKEYEDWAAAFGERGG